MEKNYVLNQFKATVLREGQKELETLELAVNKEMTVNDMCMFILGVCSTNKVKTLYVPIDVTIDNKQTSVGRSREFVRLAMDMFKLDIQLINEKKEEEKEMNNEEVKMTKEDWAEKAKEKVIEMAEFIKAKGGKVKDVTMDGIDVIQGKLEQYETYKDKVHPTFKAMGEKAEALKETLVELKEEAEERGWLDTLKAICNWVIAKTWALAKGIGMFTWDMLKLTFNLTVAYGKCTWELFNQDIIQQVKNA